MKCYLGTRNSGHRDPIGRFVLSVRGFRVWGLGFRVLGLGFWV